MKIWTIVGLGLLLTKSCFAQTASTARVDAIWAAANDRLQRQIDVWFDGGDFPTVIQLLRVQFALFPADYDVATNLGWMQENIEDWSGALATYISYRKLNPQDPDGPLPEAEFYFRKKAYAKVPALLEPAIAGAKHPHPNAYRTLAHSYEKQNLFAEAKRVYLAYLSWQPDDLTAKANLARVEKKLNPSN